MNRVRHVKRYAPIGAVPVDRLPYKRVRAGIAASSILEPRIKMVWKYTDDPAAVVLAM
jgi:hypothetical protein